MTNHMIIICLFSISLLGDENPCINGGVGGDDY